MSTLFVEEDEEENTGEFIFQAVMDGKEVISRHEYYFPAFQAFRDQLLLMGFGIQCQGSKLNAVQSPMMGASDKVYLVKMGEPARMKEVVSIWEYIALENYPNTEQQREFENEWHRSLRTQKNILNRKE